MKPKVLVLGGGDSPEREVSIWSATNVREALKSAGFETIYADPADDGVDLEELVRQVDVVFPVLHGSGGEDGVLQAMLEKLNVPFVGSDSKASRLSFDKVAMKKVVAAQQINTPRWELVDSRSIHDSQLIKHPFVIKPPLEGSSIDMTIVQDPSVYEGNLGSLMKKDPMLIEELIEGDELTVGVLGDVPLPVILIQPPEGEFFDYENKYNGKTKEIVAPKNIPADVQKRAQEIALKCHQIAGCRHLTRSDMIARADGTIFFLETNIMPGMTKESLFPKMAQHIGLDMPALVTRLVALALD